MQEPAGDPGKLCAADERASMFLYFLIMLEYGICRRQLAEGWLPLMALGLGLGAFGV